MAARILDGKAETAFILDKVTTRVAALEKIGKKACLAAIQANDDPSTDWYAHSQAKHCRNNGIEYRLIKLPTGISEKELIEEIEKLNHDPDISGIMLFTPLPPAADHLHVVEHIDPAKDAEGLNPVNMGKLMVSERVEPVPCTARAAMELIKTARPDLEGARALVIGRSAVVGKPLAILLLAQNATVTIAHSHSDVRAAMFDAEVVVAAAGASGARWRRYEKKWKAWRETGGPRPEPPNLDYLVTMDMVRRGAVVIDVGDNDIPVALDADGAVALNDKGKPAMRYAGDVDYEKVREVAGAISTPRGSVGPLTNAFLLRNVVNSALVANGLPVRTP